MKTYVCPHCGLVAYVYSPSNWGHETPACEPFGDFDNGGWEGFRERAAAMFGTTAAAEDARQIVALGVRRVVEHP